MVTLTIFEDRPFHDLQTEFFIFSCKTLSYRTLPFLHSVFGISNRENDQGSLIGATGKVDNFHSMSARLERATRTQLFALLSLADDETRRSKYKNNI